MHQKFPKLHVCKFAIKGIQTKIQLKVKHLLFSFMLGASLVHEVFHVVFQIVRHFEFILEARLLSNKVYPISSCELDVVHSIEQQRPQLHRSLHRAS